MLNLLGLAVPKDVGGRSMAGVLHGESSDAPRDRARSETAFRAFRETTVVMGGWRYIHDLRDNSAPLYTDAEARRDLLAREPEVAGQLRHLLRRWEERKDCLEQEMGPPLSVQTDRETTEMLQQMGYADREPGGVDPERPQKPILTCMNAAHVGGCAVGAPHMRILMC